MKHLSPKILKASMCNMAFAIASAFGMLSMVESYAQSPTTSLNSVTHFRPRIATSNSSSLVNNADNSQTSVSYIDGLGRPLQTVLYNGSPSKKDILANSTYFDDLGRPTKVFLAAPSTTITGGFQPNPQNLSQSFYNDNRPFSEISAYEETPLDRPLTEFGPGQAWHTASKAQHKEYEIAGSDIRRYSLDALGNITYGTYPANSLHRYRTTDEQGDKVIEIKNNMGLLIQKQVEVASGDYAITHYIYDGIGRLRAVIQPEGYALNQNIAFNDANFENYVFFYEFNSRGNVSRKHIPNAGWTSFVYDKGNRPVLEQTALQAQNDKWNFIKYDNFGRVIFTGELTNASTQASLQTLFYGVATPYETWNGTSYTYQSFPISHTYLEEKTCTYYDQYAWIASQWAFNNSTAYKASSHYTNAKGLATGGWVKSTEDPIVLFHTVMHYDNKGRVLQTYQTHQKGGSNLAQKPIRTDYEYNFAGEVTKEKVTYMMDGLSDIETLTTNEYDHVGRLMKVFHSINGAALVELCRYSYDEIGRVKEKIILPNGNFLYGGAKDYITRPSIDGEVTQANKQDIARKAIILEPIIGLDALDLTSYLAQVDPNAPPGNPIVGLQRMNYTHHIRGGLKGVNLDNAGNAAPEVNEGDLFAYKLDYETAGQWDNNIGKQSWKGDTTSERSYAYTYDHSKRLKSAAYTGVNSENYGIPNMGYDKNGNISSLQRNGLNNGSYGLIDDLSYNYGSSGNRLLGVTDGINGNADVGDFRDNNSNADYTYWADGSLKSDGNKGIQLIEYDTFLKKVKQVTWSDGRWLKFFYDGSGKLLKRQNSAGDYWEYLGGLIFKNGLFYQLATPDGRAVFDGNNGSMPQWNYEFEYRDVWGNLRVAFKADNNQLVKTQSSDFDALGFEFNKLEQSQTNNFKYQKQERIDDFDLNIDFFKYRPSDPVIGRFWAIDPLSEEFVYNSPYALQENKFGLGIELEGAELMPFQVIQGYYEVKNWLTNTNVGRSMKGALRHAENEQRHREDSGYTQNVPEEIRAKHYKEEKLNATAEMIKGGAETMETITTATGIALGGVEGTYGLVAKQLAGKVALEGVESAAKGGSTTLYRAVSKAELDDIAQFGFRTKAGGYETGKLFAPTLNEATQFGKANFMFDGIPNTIMKVRVPNSVMNGAYRFGADGMNAISIPANQLNLLRGTPLNYSPFFR